MVDEGWNRGAAVWVGGKLHLGREWADRSSCCGDLAEETCLAMIGRCGRGLALCTLEISWRSMSTEHNPDGGYLMSSFEQTKVFKRVAVAPMMGG